MSRLSHCPQQIVPKETHLDGRAQNLIPSIPPEEGFVSICFLCLLHTCCRHGFGGLNVLVTAPGCVLSPPAESWL